MFSSTTRFCPRGTRGSDHERPHSSQKKATLSVCVLTDSSSTLASWRQRGHARFIVLSIIKIDGLDPTHQ